MLERPTLALLTDEILTTHDGKEAAPPPPPGVISGLVMRLMHAMSLEDWDAAAEVLHPDCEFSIPATHVLFPARRAVGRAAVVDAVRRNLAMVKDQENRLEQFVEEGSTGIMVVRELGKTTKGLPYQGWGFFIFTVEDGLLRSMREFTVASNQDD
ncbi:MAG: nuclear transport factor 2 family protein [Myxococcales bacterium]|nr:nuclear transport factor 2 family protein [Myxococcales bacterium]MCB9735136.1 nuclear transport factor 2 family protein [Deltaproteobacteria bacterium]